MFPSGPLTSPSRCSQLSQGSAMSSDPTQILLVEQFPLRIDHPFRSPGQAGAQLYPLRSSTTAKMGSTGSN